jgi:hypothetical protein
LLVLATARDRVAKKMKAMLSDAAAGRQPAGHSDLGLIVQAKALIAASQLLAGAGRPPPSAIMRPESSFPRLSQRRFGPHNGH